MKNIFIFNVAKESIFLTFTSSSVIVLLYNISQTLLCFSQAIMNIKSSITQKIGKVRGNSYQKNEEISRQKAHTGSLTEKFLRSQKSFSIRKE